jgi:beta-glucosidase
LLRNQCWHRHEHGSSRFQAKTRLQAGHGDILRTDDAAPYLSAELGVFDGLVREPNLLNQVGSAAHRAIARRAVSESLVLLKNDNAALPIRDI